MSDPSSATLEEINHPVVTPVETPTPVEEATPTPKEEVSILVELFIDVVKKSIEDEVVRSRVERLKQFYEEKESLDQLLKDKKIKQLVEDYSYWFTNYC